MTLSKLTCALCAVIVMGAISTACSGQGLQRPLRWLGEGFGPGYHRCNPGPNSDYYNPYSAHNSMLISQLPQFQNQNYQSYGTNNLASRPVYQGVPFSVYAAPRNMHTQSFGYQPMGGAAIGSTIGSPVIDGSFEPYEPTEEDVEETREEDDQEDREEDYEDYDDMEEDTEASESKDATSKKANEDSVFKYNPTRENQTSFGLGKPNTQSGFAKTSFPNLNEANSQSDGNLFNPFEDK